jgi:hypothetical protein
MSASVRTCALTSVIQCVMVLSQTPRKQVGKLRHLARRELDVVDDDGILRCIQVLDTSLVAERQASDRADQIGAVALDALRSGKVCMLRFESNQSSRWATVIGVERDRATSKARALLLLDTSAAEPWACAHNVRIELQAVAGKSVHASAGFTLNCRHLTARPAPFACSA